MVFTPVVAQIVKVFPWGTCFLVLCLKGVRGLWGWGLMGTGEALELPFMGPWLQMEVFASSHDVNKKRYIHAITVATATTATTNTNTNTDTTPFLTR